MYNEFIGKRVNVIISSRADNLLEYTGTLVSENNEIIELSNVNISYLILNIQKGIFGDNINRYKENVNKVIVNKKYIISCND